MFEKGARMKFHEQERRIRIRRYALRVFLAAKVFFIKVITLLIFLAVNEGVAGASRRGVRKEQGADSVRIL